MTARHLQRDLIFLLCWLLSVTSTGSQGNKNKNKKPKANESASKREKTYGQCI